MGEEVESASQTYLRLARISIRVNIFDRSGAGQKALSTHERHSSCRQRCRGAAFIHYLMKACRNAHCSLSLTSMFSNRFLWVLAFLACAYPIFYNRLWQRLLIEKDFSQAPPHIQAVINKCLSLQQEPGPSPDFWKRSRSDRFERGTRPVLIKGGRIWTGRENGTQVIYGDILMEKGVIQNVGRLGWLDLTAFGGDLQVVDAKGAWITPGLVDIHSHIGNFPLPNLRGSSDGNSLNGIAQPWLRSLDGLNTHDETYPLSLAGGVTTSLVLPGSADAIGRYQSLRVERSAKTLLRRTSFCDQVARNLRKVTFLDAG